MPAAMERPRCWQGAPIVPKPWTTGAISRDFRAHRPRLRDDRSTHQPFAEFAMNYLYLSNHQNFIPIMNEIEQLELTEKSLPKAVSYLINEVADMRATLDNIEKQLGLGANKHRPILIDQAAEILHMKVGTVKRLVEERNIPHYKREHNIYFFEDELIKWVEESKVKMNTSYSYYRR